MKKYTETRRLLACDLRNLCIAEDWYTGGTCEEYNNLLYNLAESKKNITTEDIIAIAEDIMDHSTCKDETVTNIAFKVARKCYTLFEEV